MKNKFIKILDLLFRYKNFLLAYSGGIDSHVLLHFVYKVKSLYSILNIRVIHINHNINKLSLNWENFCINVCKKYNFSIIIERIFLNTLLINNIEYNLRKLRYACINNYILYNEILITAHHLDDDCETFFLNLKRHSGLLNSFSIKKYSFLKKNIFLRPFLNLKKNDLINYSKKHNLFHINDDSNLNIKYDRNFLRNNILNQIQDRWKNFNIKLQKTTKLLEIQNLILENYIFDELYKCLDKFYILNIDKLNNFVFNIKILIIKLWFKLYINLLCTTLQIYKLIEFIHTSSQTKFFVINLYNFYYFKKKLIPIFNGLIKEDKKIWNINICYFLPLNLGILIPYTKKFFIPYPKISEKVYISFFNKINQKTTIILLINIFNLLNIPIYDRNKIPLIFFNEKLISIGDLFILKPVKKKFFSFTWKSII